MEGIASLRNFRLVSIDDWEDERLFGLGRESVLRVFKRLLTLHETFERKTRKPAIFMRNERLRKYCGVSENTLYNAKKKLESKGLIAIEIQHGYGKGSICIIRLTAQGLALGEKINSKAQEKAEPKHRYKYEEGDEACAKFWYSRLRKRWCDMPGMLKSMGEWEDTKEIRCNSFRKCREKMKMTSEEVLSSLKLVAHSERSEFYYRNVLGADKMSRKWKNGLTVFETIMCEADLIRDEVRQLERKEFTESNEPEFINSDDEIEKGEEDVCEIWHRMWSTVGTRLRGTYRTKAECDYAYNSTYELCDQIANITREMNPKVSLRIGNLNNRMVNDDGYGAFWLFLLDEYSNWDNNITPQMMWNAFSAFVRKVWKLNYGRIPTEDEVADYMSPSYYED